MSLKESNASQLHVGVVGGGIAGATTALHLAEQGIKVTLIEQGSGLVNGPPICHLHAGGNLYREISQQQCIDLLKQSIETVRLYPHSLNVRPTVIATPISDEGQPEELLPRLKVIQESYRKLVEQDEANAVLGAPEDYYRLYSRDEIESIKMKTQPEFPSSPEDWMIPFCRQANLDQLKFPVVLVQEFGLSVFRLAASVTLALEENPNCQVLTHCKLISAESSLGDWKIGILDNQGEEKTLHTDFLVNASGYRTGTIDDLTKQPRKRLVEFKSAYVTHWPRCDMTWPEVIFHGARGTPDGMAQLTPYADGYFQLHGMTQNITLFEGGLVASDENSSQPKLPEKLESKISTGWPTDVMDGRTRSAIEHMSRFVPDFASAELAGKPLFGAQQIPGDDPTLRAVDVSFTDDNYARVEIVKASSAYQAALKIACYLNQEPSGLPIEEQHGYLSALSAKQIEQKALNLAKERGYPQALAKRS